MRGIKILLLLCLPLITLEAGWLNRKAEGWAWYEDKEKKAEETKEAATVILPTSTETLSKIKLELEEKLSKALLDPTPENVSEYMQSQQKWVNQSALFAQVWAKNLLSHPQLDPTSSTYPVSQYGIQLRKHLLNEKKRELIHQLSSSNGLFFFYEGGNKTSQAFALIVREFAKKHRWEVIAISVDNTLLEGFKVNKADNGIAKQIGVSLFPALYIVNPDKKHILPIGFGLLSMEKIEQNIFMQFSGEGDTIQ